MLIKCQDVAHEATEYLEKTQSKPRRFAMWLHVLFCHNCRRYIKHLLIMREFNIKKGYIKADKNQTSTILNTIRSNSEKE